MPDQSTSKPANIRQYSAIEMQQGRVDLDSDWTEQDNPQTRPELAETDVAQDAARTSHPSDTHKPPA